MVDGAGPFTGSELMWLVGPALGRSASPGCSAAGLSGTRAPTDVARWFFIGGRNGGRPAATRSALARSRRGAGARLRRVGRAPPGGERGRLAGADGLIELLRPYDAYSDPLAKKSSCSRRSPSAAAGSRSRTPRPGRSRPTTCSCGSRCARAGRGGPARRGAPATREAFKALRPPPGCRRPSSTTCLGARPG